MIIVHHYGDVGDNMFTELDNEDQLGGFALFGRQPVTAAQTNADGVDLFSARMGAFDMRMQSSTESFRLRNDLVEHLKK
jgi:hypothetical protein